MWAVMAKCDGCMEWQGLMKNKVVMHSNCVTSCMVGNGVHTTDGFADLCFRSQWRDINGL